VVSRGVRVVHMLIFCVVFLVGSVLCSVLRFACLRPVSCVPNVDSVSEYFIFKCPFGLQDLDKSYTQGFE
jgi:hypothetical protein